MGHFVIQICQKSLRNWIFTLCNKIIIWILHLTLKIKTDYISTSTKLMVTTLGRINPLIMWSHEVTWLIKNDISPLPRGPWLDKVEVCSKGPPSIESFDALIMWPNYHVTDEKRYISTSARPMATKIDRVVGSNAGLFIHQVTQPVDHVVTEGYMTNEKWNLSLSNLTERWLMIRSHMSNHKATCSFDHVFTWVHVTN